MEVQVNFVLERVTKGAIRYQEVDPAGHSLGMTDVNTVIGTLYLRKWGLRTQGLRAGQQPSNISIIIEIPED